MYQVNFSDQAISELNKLDKTKQMLLIENLCHIDIEELKNKSTDELGFFQRNKKTFYRLRVKTLRLYFEILDLNCIHCHYILHKHTLTDFIFRFKLPVSEEQMVEQHQSFWKYLETLKT